MFPPNSPLGGFSREGPLGCQLRDPSWGSPLGGPLQAVPCIKFPPGFTLQGVRSRGFTRHSPSCGQTQKFPYSGSNTWCPLQCVPFRFYPSGILLREETSTGPLKRVPLQWVPTTGSPKGAHPIVSRPDGSNKNDPPGMPSRRSATGALLQDVPSSGSPPGGSLQASCTGRIIQAVQSRWSPSFGSFHGFFSLGSHPRG